MTQEQPTEKKINEHILKISHKQGGYALENGLVRGRRYRVAMEIDVYEVAESELKTQNETIDIIYKSKNTGDIEILDQGKNIVKAKDKSERSRALHGAIWLYHNENGLTEEFDEFYSRTMGKMISYLPEIINFLNTKN